MFLLSLVQSDAVIAHEYRCARTCGAVVQQRRDYDVRGRTMTQEGVLFVSLITSAGSRNKRFDRMCYVLCVIYVRIGLSLLTADCTAAAPFVLESKHLKFLTQMDGARAEFFSDTSPGNRQFFSGWSC